MPFRTITLLKELNSQRGIPSKKAIKYNDTCQFLLESVVCKGLAVLADTIKLSRKNAIPFGFVFATRPFSLTELYLLFKNPYSAETMEQLCQVILALRGTLGKGQVTSFDKRVP